jgi:hypothetical protein
LTAIAAAALVTSFFGAEVLRPNHVPFMGWVALAFFVALGGCVLVILWPKKEWEFEVSASDLIATYLEPAQGKPVPLPSIYRDLALHMSAAGTANRDRLKTLMASFRFGTAALVLEVLAWVVLLADHA